MRTTTLKEVTKKLGISLKDTVQYIVEGDKGIIIVNLDASDSEIELSAISDQSEDFISQEELDYYLKLEDL